MRRHLVYLLADVAAFVAGGWLLWYIGYRGLLEHLAAGLGSF